jgi:hypothetical protein
MRASGFRFCFALRHFQVISHRSDSRWSEKQRRIIWLLSTKHFSVQLDKDTACPSFDLLMSNQTSLHPCPFSSFLPCAEVCQSEPITVTLRHKMSSHSRKQRSKRQISHQNESMRDKTYLRKAN